MVESTHDVSLGRTTVTKRYRSWDRGEPEREWHALSLLHHHCTGLAPVPLEFTRDLSPAIVMSRLPGVPLGADRLTHAELVAVAGAMQRLHHSLPPTQLDDLDERQWGPQELLAGLRASSGERHAGVDRLVEASLEAATSWLEEVSESDLLGPSSTDRVFTLADGNLGNFIWDGERCRVVDFEDSGVSQAAFEVADFVEHVSVWLRELVDTDVFLKALDMSPDQRERLLNCRRLFAVFWLRMLLPGAPGHKRNPAESLERQAKRLLNLVAL